MSGLTALAGRLREEEAGHVGNGLTCLSGIGAAVAIVIAFAADSDAAGIVGGVLVGLGFVLAANAPHNWLRSIYARLDKLDPNDPEAQPEKRFRIQF